MARFIRPTTGRITSFYGRRKHPITGVMGGHHGIDIAMAGKVAVKATASGTVSRARSDGMGGTYGNVVTIKHANRWESLYAHLRQYTVRPGQWVTQGQVIGYMGNTGGSTGQHLHFELHKGGWNKYYSNEVNPLEYYYDVSVQELQAKLIITKVDIVADGWWGPATAHAVRLFQSRTDLEVDGSAGPATIRKLDGVVARINAEAIAEVERKRKEAADKAEQKRLQEEQKQREAEMEAERKRLEQVATSNKKEKEEEIQMEKEKHLQASESLAEDVAEGVKLGITDGTYLHRPATREEVIAMIVRAMKQK